LPEYFFVFITDAIWTLSWFVFLIGSLKLKDALFPPKLIPLILTWEVLAVFQKVPWPWSLNYYFWLLITPCNLYLTYKYSRLEYMKDLTGFQKILRVLAEVIGFGLIILLSLKFFGLNIYYILGGAMNVVISLYFYLYIRKKVNLSNWNLAPNLLRIFAGNLGTVAVALTFGNRWIWELLFIRSGILILDVLYISSWLKARKHNNI
jgi:hypothetical protein